MVADTASSAVKEEEEEGVEGDSETLVETGTLSLTSSISTKHKQDTKRRKQHRGNRYTFPNMSCYFRVFSVSIFVSFEVAIPRFSKSIFSLIDPPSMKQLYIVFGFDFIRIVEERNSIMVFLIHEKK